MSTDKFRVHPREFVATPVPVEAGLVGTDINGLMHLTFVAWGCSPQFLLYLFCEPRILGYYVWKKVGHDLQKVKIKESVECSWVNGTNKVAREISEII